MYKMDYIKKLYKDIQRATKNKDFKALVVIHNDLENQTEKMSKLNIDLYNAKDYFVTYSAIITLLNIIDNNLGNLIDELDNLIGTCY